MKKIESKSCPKKHVVNNTELVCMYDDGHRGPCLVDGGDFMIRAKEPPPPSMPRIGTWSLSLSEGQFVLNCPFPVGDESRGEIAALLEIIKRQIMRVPEEED